MKLNQKGLVVRYLYSRGVGNWVPGYDIVKYASGGPNIIQDGDTRAYDIIRDDNGIYESFNARYKLEHRKVGKYAEFRVAKREQKALCTPDYRDVMARNV